MGVAQFIPAIPSDIGAAADVHTHALADVTGLVSALALKANSASLGTAAALNTGTSSGQIPVLGAGGFLPSSVVPATDAVLSVNGQTGVVVLDVYDTPTIDGFLFEINGDISELNASKLAVANNLSDLEDPGTARFNLSVYSVDYIDGVLGSLSSSVSGVSSSLTSHAAATTGTHGVAAGAIVGTTLTQTLTNKTLTAPTLTGTTTAASLTAGVSTFTTSGSDNTPGVLVKHDGGLSSASYREGLVVGEGIATGEMTLSLWTDGANNKAFIQAVTWASLFTVPLVLQPNGGTVETPGTFTAGSGVIQANNLTAEVSALSIRDATQIAHGLTAIATTDTWFQVHKESVSNGGAVVSGFSDNAGAPGLFLDGVIGVTDPTDTTPAVVVRAWRKGSTSRVNLNAAERAFEIRNGSTSIVTVNGSGDLTAASLTTSSTISPGTYTVATLPTPGTARRIAYASNARKNGEGSGAGTGAIVFDDGVAWRVCDTGATAAS